MTNCRVNSISEVISNPIWILGKNFTFLSERQHSSLSKWKTRPRRGSSSIKILHLSSKSVTKLTSRRLQLTMNGLRSRCGLMWRNSWESQRMFTITSSGTSNRTRYWSLFSRQGLTRSPRGLRIGKKNLLPKKHSTRRKSKNWKLWLKNKESSLKMRWSKRKGNPKPLSTNKLQQLMQLRLKRKN